MENGKYQQIKWPGAHSLPSLGNALSGAEVKQSQARIDLAKLIFDPVRAKAFAPPADVCEGFPPVGEVSAIAGDSNVGKTSLIAHYVAKASKAGHKTIVLSYDMRRDYLMQYFLAYGARDNSIVIIDTPISHGELVKTIEFFIVGVPHLLFVVDPFLDFFLAMTGQFLTDDKGKERKFDANNAQCWVDAFAWFREWIKNHRLSVLGALHTAKGKFSHDLPLSGKFKAYLHSANILYRAGRSSMLGHPVRWLAEFVDNAPKGTHLLYNMKDRSRADITHVSYRLGEECDSACLNPMVKFRPKLFRPFVPLDEADHAMGMPIEDVITINPNVIVDVLEGDQWTSTTKINRRLKLRDDDHDSKKIVKTLLHGLVGERKAEYRKWSSGCQWRLVNKGEQHGNPAS